LRLEILARPIKPEPNNHTGPLIMVVSFVGFVGSWTKEIFGAGKLLLSGAAEASIAILFTFLSSFYLFY